MASVKRADIPEVARFMTDIWAFMKAFWIPEDDDGYWEEVLDRAGELGRRYQHDFCKAGICFVVDYLEWRHEKDKGKTRYEFYRWLYMRYRGHAGPGPGDRGRPGEDSRAEGGARMR